MSVADWQKSTIRLIAGLSLIFMLFTAAEAHAQHRVALVIGNSDYRNAAPLPKPVKDAASMANLFKDAGFDTVVAETDVGYVDFKRAIRKFQDAANDSDIAVVFYAGHGIEIDGVNYLVPVDATLATDSDVQDEAVRLDRLVNSVEGAKQLRLVILDASRANPFIKTMKHTMAGSSKGQGLTRVEPTSSNLLIAYAAKAGSTVDDDDSEHSPFTTSLLANLTIPGLDIRLAFGRIRDQVLKITGNRQEPFVYGALGSGAMAIVPASIPAKLARTIPSTFDAARQDYEFISKIGTKSAWQVFLGTYPTGLFAELARANLAGLQQKEANVCLLDCVGERLHTNTCDAVADVCFEMAEKECHAVISNSADKCGSDASRK